MSLKSRWIANVVLLSVVFGLGVPVSNAEPMRVSAGSAVRVTRVVPDQSGNFVLLNVEGKQPLPVPTPSYYPGPDGHTIMAVDFAGVSFMEGSRVFEPANPDFELVRFGQFQADPPIFRISITTSNPSLFKKIEFRSGQGKLLVLFPSDMRSIASAPAPHAVHGQRHHGHQSNLQHRITEPAGTTHVSQDPRSGQFFPTPAAPPVAPSRYRSATREQRPASQQIASHPKPLIENVPTQAMSLPEQRSIKDRVSSTTRERANASESKVGVVPPLKVWSPQTASSVAAPATPSASIKKEPKVPARSEQLAQTKPPVPVANAAPVLVPVPAPATQAENLPLERISAEAPLPRKAKKVTQSPQESEPERREAPRPAPDFVRTASLPPMPPLVERRVDDDADKHGKYDMKRRNTFIAKNSDVSSSLNERKTSDQIPLSNSSVNAASSKVPPVAPDLRNGGTGAGIVSDVSSRTSPSAEVTAKKVATVRPAGGDNKVPPLAPDRLSWSDAIDSFNNQSAGSSVKNPVAAPAAETVSAGPIQITRTAKDVKLTLRLSGDHKSFKLDDPSRFVIDLDDGLPETLIPPTVPENPYFTAIRFGTPDEDGKFTRIVVDLAGNSDVREEAKDDVLTLSFGAGSPNVASTGRRVVLDAGHGGSDPGAQRGDIQEKDLTMQITERLRKNLESRGVSVVMTRSDDSYVSLEDRVRITNEQKPDAFVSVHINSLESNNGITGIETYYQNDVSKRLAQSVHGCLVDKLAVPDRNVRKAKFFVVNHTPHPAILAEVGFISNKEERDRLISSEYQSKIAESIAQGIMSYLDTAATASAGNEAPASSSAKQVSLVEEAGAKRPK